MKMFKDGPATSFKASPIVSPITAAVCVGVPFNQKAFASMLFFVLSHNPPPIVKNDAKSAAVHVPPSNMPPKVLRVVRKRKPLEEIVGLEEYGEAYGKMPPD